MTRATEGYMYILLNRAFQNDQYKIGMTTKSPEKRARELSGSSGVPREFEVLYAQKVVDCRKAERLLHERLDHCRLNSRREFFQIPLNEAIILLEAVAYEVGKIGMSSPSPQANFDPQDNTADQKKRISTSIESNGQADGYCKPKLTTVSFADHAAYVDEPRRQILIELRKRLHRQDIEEVCTPRQRIAYSRKGTNIFLEIKVQRAAIVLHLIDGGRADGDGVLESIPKSHGWGRLKKRIKLTEWNDLEAAMPFVEAAYHKA